MNSYRYLLIVSFLFTITAFSQQKKQLQINRTDQAPKIDGVLDDAVWQTAQEAKDFIQFRPDMGKPESDDIKTIVKMAYDDSGIYVGAYLYDDPSKIMKQFTSRDNFGQSDFFGVIFNPNNDAQNDVSFFVFSSGTQADAVSNPSNGEDFGWNAVWDSAVKIVDNGWVIEMKIPYRALRFSNDEVQTWGIQFHRRFRRNNEQYSWNPLDISKGYPGLYHGELVGLKNIKPPLRLNLYPFASTIFDSEDKPTYNVGMDVKYGITENFTLDATLIPDFSQAAFDNLSLNLGPFEQTFGEQRQFFKEGIDLFSKGNLFFSRRIGSRPTGSNNLTDEDEYVDYPNEVKVLNALKISGRSKSGWGIGFFNAITEKTEARVKRTTTVFNEDTQQDENFTSFRDEVVEPFTNYNITVVDKQFNGNSSIGIINTNVLREGHFKDANVTALVSSIANKRNTYRIRTDLKLSNRNLLNGNETGFSSFFFIGKTHGKFRYSFDHSLSDTKFNINDLGLNNRNNFNNYGADVSYQIFEPTKTFNSFNINAWYNYRQLYKPKTFTGQNFGVNTYMQFKNLWEMGGNANYQPDEQFDFFEPRDFANKRFFIKRNRLNMNTWFNTNPNKKFMFNGWIGFAKFFEKRRDSKNLVYWYGINPTFRFSDKFSVAYELNIENVIKGRGYANNSNSLQNEIVFGQRDRRTTINGLYGNYNFNPFHSIRLNFRNYWSTVKYEANPYFLQEDGNLVQSENTFEELGLDSSDINYSTWNVDLSYSWQFAPGSFLTALYRNSIVNVTEFGHDDYFKSLDNLLDEEMQHIFSLRVQYFIDYNGIKNIFKKKNKMESQAKQASTLMNKYRRYNSDYTL